MKKVFIKTFGCQMNEYDSSRIYDSVSKIGYNKSDELEKLTNKVFKANKNNHQKRAS